MSSQSTVPNENASLVRILTVLAFLLLAFMCAIMAFIAMQVRNSSATSFLGETAVSAPAPITASNNNGLSPQAPPVITGGNSNDVSFGVDPPAQLQINGELITILPAFGDPKSSPDWPNVDIESGTAVWAYGSVLNYIFAISPQDEALVSQLQPKEPIVFTTQSGQTFRFSYRGEEQLDRSAPTLFKQTSPQITLFVPNSANTVTIYTGDYLLDSDIMADTSFNQLVAFLGEPVQLADLQLTVSGANYLLNAPTNSPDTAFYIVTYQIFNQGETPFNNSSLQFSLVDEQGGTYTASSNATAQGFNPTASGQIMPDSIQQQFDVGFEIPRVTSPQTFSLIVSRNDIPANNLAQISLPLNVSQSTLANINIESIIQNNATINVVGQIQNQGNLPLFIRPDDVQMLADGNPLFLQNHYLGEERSRLPWQVSPNETVGFYLEFTLPPPNTQVATFNLLDKSFELIGLR